MTSRTAETLEIPAAAPPQAEDWSAFRYGVAAHEDIAGLSGREILQRIIDGHLPHPPICQVLTFRLVAVGEGFAAFEGDTGVHLYNPLGTVHGGWALTMIDSAAGCAGMSLLPAGSGYTTVETKGNLSRPIRPQTGRVRCESKVVSQGRQIISCEARVTGPDGRLLAHGTSTLFVMAAP
ncbi:PaaI family thioesterase [Marinibaculum pumilum]|uniref:PaaI family thioesterase n=1 Tax=Marinibaculum pumilum TaxID=1766165 RepID=A0ABV7L199_9PROT